MFGLLALYTLACGLVGYLYWLFERVRCSKTGQARRNDETKYSGSMQVGSSILRPDVHRHKQVIPLLLGALLSGFFFVSTLSQYLSRENRPTVPDAALGFTYLTKVKFGSIYGTHFEYLAITYGVWFFWAGLLIVGIIGKARRLFVVDESLAFPVIFFIGSSAAMVIYYLSWRVSFSS